MKIICEKRPGNVIACIAELPSIWAVGRNPNEALGALIKGHPELFNIEIEWIDDELTRRQRALLSKEAGLSLNEEVALAMGWKRREDRCWVNLTGGITEKLPDFSGDSDYSQVVIGHFRSFVSEARCKERFFSEYKTSMNPEEVCRLALRIFLQNVE